MYFFLFFFAISIRQIDKEPIIYDGINDASAAELIFIGTNFGILKFDRTTKTWGRITKVNGLPDDDIRIIALNEGIMWVGTNNGLASADIRLNDWQNYGFNNLITGIDFDDDYVWVGCEGGLVRIDKYTERWDTILGIKINTLHSDGNVLWLGTDEGIFQYSLQFAKMEKMVEVQPIPIDFIIGGPRKLWFLAESLFYCYDRMDKSWQQYQGFKIKDYQNIGDSLFILSDGKLIYFNPQTGNWHEFVDIGEIRGLNGFAANYKNLILATNDGIVLYDLKEHSRKTYTKANGLMNDTIIDVYEDNSFLFAISNDRVQYMDKKNGIWQIEKLEKTRTKFRKILYYDDGGLHTVLHEAIDTRLQGRIYNAGSLRISKYGIDTTFYRDINLKILVQHKNNRLLSMYYDDTDKAQTMYGLSYRGLDNDMIYRLNAGYIQSGYYELNIIPEFSTLGGNAKIKYQEHILDLQGGVIKSNLEKDFFYGRSKEIVDTILDIDFQKNIFYYIYDGPKKINKGFDTIFVDDRIETNNDIDTRIGMKVAGVTGNFDPFINGIDYMIDYDNGIIHFLKMPNSKNSFIVILLNNEWIVIKSDSVFGHQVENIYSLGPGLIPNTVELIIIDTTGEIHPLAEFGIDMDNDQRVDPQFINCDIGYLKFPSRRPFPAQVYDDTINIYSMVINYTTNVAFYNLSFNPVLPGSEKVYVDGKLLSRGSDYILDYTSGRLIFIKKGIVNNLSEIEIQYMWIQRNGREFYYTFQPNIVITEGINIAPGIGVVKSESLLFFTGRMEKNAGNKGIKLTPQVAINKNKTYAQRYEMLVNYGNLGLTADYANFDEKFETFGMNQKKFGRLDKEFDLGLRLEPLPNIKLEGNHKQEYQTDSINNQHTLKYNNFKFAYLKPKLPNLYISLGKDYISQYNKDKIQFGTNYESELKKAKLNFNSVINNEHLESEIQRDKIFEYYLNINLSMPFPVSLNLNLRDSKFYQFNEKTNDEDELRFTTNIDLIPGIYYMVNYEGNILKYNLGYNQDLSLKSYFYTGLNIAPGRWHYRMSLVNLGLGAGRGFNEYLSNMPKSFIVPAVLISPVFSNRISSLNNSNNYFVTLQLTPFSDLFIWFKESISETGFAYYSFCELTKSFTEEMRVEYNLNNIGLFNTNYIKRRQYSYPQKTFHNLYIVWTKSFSALLRAKIYTDFQNNIENYGTVKDEKSNIKLATEVLLQFKDKNFLLLNLAGVRTISDLKPVEYSIIPGLGLNVNLMKFLYLQFDYQSDIFYDYANHNISTKIIGNF